VAFASVQPSLPAASPISLAQRGVIGQIGARAAGGSSSTRPNGGASRSAGAGALVAALAIGIQQRRGGRSERRATARAAAERKRVVVTGLGLITPFGTDPDKAYEKLCEGTSAVQTITKFDPKGLTTTIAAQITGFTAEGYVNPKNERRMDDVVKYTIVAGKKALEDAGLGMDTEAFKNLNLEKCGVLIGSAMGGTSLQTSMDNMEKILAGKKASPFFVPYTLVNVPGGLLAIDLGFQGPNYAVITACATGNYCITAAAEHIAKGEVDVAVAGGAEASVTRAGIAGFIGCKALSKRNDEPEKASRPWDQGRDGFVMGEGAGVLCLEELEHAKARGATIYAEYLGGAFTCDAYDMTAPHPKGDGVSRCIRMALENSGVKPEEVGYLNTHGTSTPAGDMAEVRAIERGFDQKTDNLVINSTKSMLGHCLGAAAGVEAVVTVMALKTGKVHPTLNHDNPEPDFKLKTPVGKAMDIPDLKVAASNSFGFGGHNSCIVFRKYED
jgi:3-oxoacyl-[acyl-carrier-protein] synthase II